MVRIAVILFSGFILCSACTAPVHDRTKLDSGWYWAPEGAQHADFVPLPAGALENVAALLPASSGVLWLRTTFYVPSSLDGHDLSLYGGRIARADRVWVNDVFIGGEGNFAPSFSDGRWMARNYTIPAISLNRGTANTLLVQMHVNRAGFITGRPFIGLRDDVRRAAEHTRFLYSTLFLLFCVLCLFIAVQRCAAGRTAGWLYLAVLAIITAVRLFPHFEADTSFLLFNSALQDRLGRIFVTGGLYIQLWLLNRWLSGYLGRTEPFAFKALLFLFMILPLTGIILLSNHSSAFEMISWFRFLIVPPVLYLLYSVIESVIRRNERVLYFLVAMIPPLLSLPLYLFALLSTGNAAAFPFVSLFWPLVVMLLHFIQPVAPVQPAAPAVSVASVQPDPVLVQCERELAECHRLLDQHRYDRKLEEAAFTRFRSDLEAPSFFETGSWEVYKATVSGKTAQADFSACYTGEAGLEGLALFQVAGDEVMGPVLSVVCAPLIEHCFREGGDRMLPDIMSTINDALCGVLAGFTGRLTGTLIRIKPDRLEYVNAGHPHVLLRSAKTSRVREVRLSGKDNRGPALGSCGLGPRYTAVGFSMQSQDALLLYTDLHGSDAASRMTDEQAARISAAFAAAGNSSSAAVLDAVIKSYRSETTGHLCEADQTFIMLRRR